MIASVFESAWRPLRYPSVIVPAAVATVGSHLAFKALGADQGFWMLPMSAMPPLVMVVAIRFWIGLCVSATALAILRGGGHWRPTVWVAPTTAFEIAAVSIALAIPILACLVFLIVPGVILALRWSQTIFILLDEEAHWLESAGASAELVHGHKLDILAIWVIVGVALAGVGWWLTVSSEIAAAIGLWSLVSRALEWSLRVGADAFSLVVLAALYHRMRDRPV